MTDTQFAFDPMTGTQSEASCEVRSEDVRAHSSGAACRAKAPGAGHRGHPLRRPGVRMVTKMLPLALGALVVSLLTLTGCTSSHSSDRPSATASSSKAKPKANCGSSGCALVKTTRSLPEVTVFYGASCSGINGSWFFNAVEGGGTAALRPSYSLRWSFAAGATTAKPSARINVPPASKTTVRLSLSAGTMKLSGTPKHGGSVTATGTLVVKLSGTASAPSLTFIEHGLRSAEHQLGLRSPFNVDGHPLVVPVQHATYLAGC